MSKGRYTTIDTVIERVHEKWGFIIDETSALEQIFYVLGRIADPSTFETRFDETKIEDYRGLLPIDFYEMLAINDLNTVRALQSNEDLMSRFDETRESKGIDTAEFTYDIKDLYIYVGFEEGNIEFSYKAYPFDENGKPKIPFEAKALEACADYIALAHGRRLYMSDRLSERKFSRLEQEALFSTASFRNSTKMPSINEMESMKNRYLQILSNPDLHQINFKNKGYRYE